MQTFSGILITVKHNYLANSYHSPFGSHQDLNIEVLLKLLVGAGRFRSSGGGPGQDQSQCGEPPTHLITLVMVMDSGIRMIFLLFLLHIAECSGGQER